MGPIKLACLGETGVGFLGLPPGRPNLALPLGPLRAGGTLSSGRPRRSDPFDTPLIKGTPSVTCGDSSPKGGAKSRLSLRESCHDVVVTERAALLSP